MILLVKGRPLGGERVKRDSRRWSRYQAILLLVLTELDSDRHLTPWFPISIPSRSGNGPRTTYNDCWPMSCHNGSGNWNKCYIVHNVSGVNNPTLGLNRLWLAGEPDKTGKRLWRLDSVFCPSLAISALGPAADRLSIVWFGAVPAAVGPSGSGSIDGLPLLKKVSLNPEGKKWYQLTLPLSCSWHRACDNSPKTRRAHGLDALLLWTAPPKNK